MHILLMCTLNFFFCSSPQRSPGYFVHHFAPSNLPRISKNVVFLIDQSGSMHGKKMEQVGRSFTMDVLAAFQPFTSTFSSMKNLTI